MGTVLASKVGGHECLPSPCPTTGKISRTPRVGHCKTELFFLAVFSVLSNNMQTISVTSHYITNIMTELSLPDVRTPTAAAAK